MEHKHLVIVESPAKAKTIKKYLGSDYQVLASYGHVRDLLPKSGAVDPKNNFAMKYEIIARNAKYVEEIVKAAKKADSLWLAPDPDREGEAIAWNIAYILNERKAIKDKPVHRVVFHEITKTAILEAMAHPREIAMDLVEAQQARRALDYLVGFTLSPLLWKKVRRGLSAGRVQSPALRLIVEREIEIEKFISQEYWSIESDLAVKEGAFSAKLAEYQGKKVEQFSFTNDKDSNAVKADLEKQSKGVLIVSRIEKKQRKRNPAPPFITSTLQQEAARKLGFTTKRTMQVAQQLYEGVDIGTASVGLISYMRTDSVNLANEAVEEIRQVITKKYGADAVPNTPHVYKTKSKNAQEAHEAIRPTASDRRPELIKEYLTPEQFKLYDLIWKRTVACQMIPATIDTVSVDLTCGDVGNRFRANGSTIKIPGFMSVYMEGKDDVADDEEKLLPPLKEGQAVDLKAIRAEQHFTEPPPRYSEASLVKALEEFGIGRPSTYSSIISTLQQREYATLDKKRFYPTDVGRVVTKFLTEHFRRYVDYDFTAKLEDELDQVALGKMQWIPLLEKFWKPFHEQIGKIEGSVQRSDVTQEKMDEACPKCGKPLSLRLGRSGRFIGCTGYPECDYTRNVNGENDAENAKEILGDRKCPNDGADLVIKQGPYGKFIGCSNYPKCKFIEPLEKPKDTQVLCPKCKDGTILERKSKRGKIFYSCSKYPTCDYALWNPPIAEPCPKCAWPILTLKTTKSKGTQKVCPQDDCGFVEDVE
jgi:DNA topoisomerase-1